MEMDLQNEAKQAVKYFQDDALHANLELQAPEHVQPVLQQAGCHRR